MTRPTTGLLYLVMLSVGCAGTMNGSGTAGLSGVCLGDMGTSDAAQRVEAFLAAANEFSAASSDLRGSLLTACRQMGRDLGVPDSELGMGNGVEATSAACARVSQQLRQDLAAVRAHAALRAEVAVTPPRCEVEVDAYARCAGECDAHYTPGEVELQCEGGELRGTCEAQCTGHCAVEASGSCAGVCEGACSGATDATGRCAGTCQGRCVTEFSGSCGGECRGGCSVRFRAPRCTGRVAPPRVSADCRAACDARFDARAQCTPGRADLRITGDAGPELQDKVARLSAALRGGYGTLLTLSARLERVQRSGSALGQSIQGLPQAAQRVGVAAVACAGSAVAASAEAVASINVSVQVSVQVSASVQAQ